MCLYPRLILNPKYKPNKKNGGRVPPVLDKRVLYVPIGCKKCMECKKQKTMNWKARLLEDIKTNTNGQFVTLTFSNEEYTKLKELVPKSEYGYDIDNAIATIAVRRFCERWRKRFKKSIRHWLVTELGHKGTENIHLHGILWTNEPPSTIKQIWNYGFIWAGYDNKRTVVNGATINYIVKYIYKQDLQHKEYESIILTSSGIGGNYTNTPQSQLHKYNHDETNVMYRLNNGFKIPLPIYYKNKIFNDNEKEWLWLYKLDKQVRYINGIQIDITNGYEEYFKVLNEQRNINNRLGYGDDKINWERKEYENKLRELKQNERNNKNNKNKDEEK